MPTQQEIDAAQAAVDALKQQKVNEDGAPVSKQYVDDVMNGVVAINPAPDTEGNPKEVPTETTNIKAKGITTSLDVVDGEWVELTLPLSGTVDDKALMRSFHAVLIANAGGQRIDLNGDGGPIVVRLQHKKAARYLKDFEAFFA